LDRPQTENVRAVVAAAAPQSTFDLTAEETAEIMRLSEEQSRTAAPLYEFTSA